MNWLDSMQYILVEMLKGFQFIYFGGHLETYNILRSFMEREAIFSTHGTYSTLRQDLKEMYATDENIIYIRGFLSERYDIRRYFTRLRISTEYATSRGDLSEKMKWIVGGESTNKKSETSVIEELLDRDSSTNKILLLGEPGVGKSTLVQFILYQWAVNMIWKE